MAYEGGGEYSKGLVVEHVAGQHSGYINSGCRRCSLVEGQLESGHNAGRHGDVVELCILCRGEEIDLL